MYALHSILRSPHCQALLKGMVTRAGTVLGLTKDSKYSVDVYVGSELSRLTLRADSRALAAMKTYDLTDYTFLEDKVLRIDIPQSLPTGYYLVNGKGLFRYVAGSAYDENTDFNAPEEVIPASAHVRKYG